MSKFSIAARVVELRQANPTTRSLSSAEVEETLLQHFLRAWRSQRSVHAKSVPSAHLDAQIVEERSGEVPTHKSSPYNLASNNPHVIAATLFSKKRW